MIGLPVYKNLYVTKCDWKKYSNFYICQFDKATWGNKTISVEAFMPKYLADANNSTLHVIYENGKYSCQAVTLNCDYEPFNEKAILIKIAKITK